MRRKFGLREVTRFHFHNFMSRGTRAQLIGLAVLTTGLIVVFAVLLYALQLDPNSELTLGSALWGSMTKLLRGKAPGWTPEHPAYMTIMLVMLIVGMLLVSILIGIFSSGFRSLMLRMQAGRSPVPVTGHTLILGWSPSLIGIVAELVIASESVGGPNYVVILADRDKLEMDDELRSGVPHRGKTRIVTRRGDPFRYTDLELVNIDGARSIIVLPPKRVPGRRQRDISPDMEVIKTLMAVVNNPTRQKHPYHIVTAIHDERNVEVARMAAGGEVELIPSIDVISRITAQTCRQSGLPMVYSEIMSYRGAELYFTTEPRLDNHPFRDAVYAYSASCVLGVFADGRPILNPDAERTLQSGDQLIVLAEDDSTIAYDPLRGDVAGDEITNAPQGPMPAERTLVLGWNAGAKIILTQLDGYVMPGSEVSVLVPHRYQLDEVRQLGGEMKNQTYVCTLGDPARADAFESLDVATYDHIILLSYDELDPTKSDSKVLVTLLRVRNLLDKSGRNVAVVSEMVLERNSSVARSSRDDDFVVGDHMVGLLYSQISENRELNGIFNELLREEGSEIYLKPAEGYVTPGKSVNFYTVVEAALRKGEIAIGYRRIQDKRNAAKNHGVTLNPAKPDPITFEPGDRIIVLAEDYLR